MINIRIQFDDEVLCCNTRFSLLDVLVQLGNSANAETQRTDFVNCIEGYVTDMTETSVIKVTGQGSHFTPQDKIEIRFRGPSEYHTLAEIYQIFYQANIMGI